MYLIDQATGRIVWTLGVKASSFRLGHGARFWFQHDAQMLARDRVSMFDGEAGPPIKARSSRGIRLALGMRHRTARLVRQYRRPGHDTLAESEGSGQNLDADRAFVGFGSSPFFTEFSAGGRLLFDASLASDDRSYRAYSFPCKATPKTRPTAVAPPHFWIQRQRLRELERSHHRRPLAGAGPTSRWVIQADRHGTPPRFRDTDRSRHLREHIRGTRVERERPGAGHLSTGACVMRTQWAPKLLVGVAVSITVLVAWAPAAQTAAGGIHRLRHIVIIMQENHSFDNYFGTFPGADGIPRRHGRPTVCAPDPLRHRSVRPYHDSHDLDYGGPHEQQAFDTDYDNGRMDGFVRARETCSNALDPGDCIARLSLDGLRDGRGVLPLP